MRPKLIYSLLVVAAVGVGWLLVSSLERYEESVDRGWSEAALRNPFLAAEKFLQAHAIRVRSTERIDVFDNLSVDETLLVRDAGVLSNGRFAAALEAWLLAGGHAIVEAPWFEDAVYTSSRFGVYKERDNEDRSDWNSDGAEAFEDMREAFQSRARRGDIRRQAVRDGLGSAEVLRQLEGYADPDRLTYLQFIGDDFEVVLDFGNTGFLHHKGDEDALRYWAGNEYGATFLQLNIGEGMLTVVSSTRVWNSENIGLFDHAYVLRGLVEDSNGLLILTGVQSLSLFEMILKNFRELVAVLVLSIFAWLIYRARRFGPVLATQGDERRSFMEHIQAVGHFMWRQKHSEALIEGLREDLWQTARRRFQINENMSDAEKFAPLMQCSGLDYSQLQDLMQGPAPDDEIQFSKMVKLLQEIRKTL